MMIQGLAIVPPVIGRISIGKLVNKEGRWLPEKEDSFTLTTQYQNREGWVLHPLHQHYADLQNGKIRCLPVRLLFNHSDLNLRAEYSAFDREKGRPVCVGNGEIARNTTKGKVEEIACPTPDKCPFAKQLGCKLYGRLNIQVEGQKDDLGSFMFRTTGYNSVRTLAARIRYFEAVSGGNSRYLPLLLRLRAKSTTQSFRTPVFYVDLTLRDDLSLADAVAQAKESARIDQEAGVEWEKLENMASLLLGNGLFEETEEEVPQVMEEFYPEAQYQEKEPANPQLPENTHGNTQANRAAVDVSSGMAADASVGLTGQKDQAGQGSQTGQTAIQPTPVKATRKTGSPANTSALYKGHAPRPVKLSGRLNQTEGNALPMGQKVKTEAGLINQL